MRIKRCVAEAEEDIVELRTASGLSYLNQITILPYSWTFPWLKIEIYLQLVLIHCRLFEMWSTNCNSAKLSKIQYLGIMCKHSGHSTINKRSLVHTMRFTRLAAARIHNNLHWSCSEGRLKSLVWFKRQQSILLECNFYFLLFNGPRNAYRFRMLWVSPVPHKPPSIIPCCAKWKLILPLSICSLHWKGQLAHATNCCLSQSQFLSPDQGHWTCKERNRDSMFVAHGSPGLYSQKMDSHSKEVLSSQSLLLNYISCLKFILSWRHI